jgi:WD40 repeat protein
VSFLDTGHVYGTNMLPDGDTMLLHDAFGGILVIKNICDPEKAYIHKLIQVRPWNDRVETLGGKGDFLDHYRYYLCNGWTDSSMYLIDIKDDYSVARFMDSTPDLSFSDDLVINREQTLAYSSCYGSSGYIAVTDIIQRKVVNKIPSGKGTCGLTLSSDKRYAVASNDGEASVTVYDTADMSKRKYSAQDAFDSLKINSCIQGISCGADDCVYVYDCGGNGALVRFYPFRQEPYCEVSYAGGYCRIGAGE